MKYSLAFKILITFYLSENINRYVSCRPSGLVILRLYIKDISYMCGLQTDFFKFSFFLDFFSFAITSVFQWCGFKWFILRVVYSKLICLLINRSKTCMQVYFFWFCWHLVTYVKLCRHSIYCSCFTIFIFDVDTNNLVVRNK